MKLQESKKSSLLDAILFLTFQVTQIGLMMFSIAPKQQRKGGSQTGRHELPEDLEGMRNQT